MWIVVSSRYCEPVSYTHLTLPETGDAVTWEFDTITRLFASGHRASIPYPIVNPFGF